MLRNIAGKTVGEMAMAPSRGGPHALQSLPASALGGGGGEGAQTPSLPSILNTVTAVNEAAAGERLLGPGEREREERLLGPFSDGSRSCVIYILNCLPLPLMLEAAETRARSRWPYPPPPKINPGAEVALACENAGVHYGCRSCHCTAKPRGTVTCNRYEARSPRAVGASSLALPLLVAV